MTRILPLAALLLLPAHAALVGAMCVGDCDGDGSVTVSELIAMVNVALEQAPAESCTAGDVNGDGAITVGEIVMAVGSVLNGCPTPTPTTVDTPTPTAPTTVPATPTATATATPAGTVCVPFDAGDLLQNSDAESGPASLTGAEIVAVPGWQTTSSFTVVAYGAPGFPDATIAADILGGANFFAGGPATGSSTASQTVDVAAFAPSINAGCARVTLGADLGGADAQSDAGTVDAIYRDAGGQEISRLTIGPLTAADRGGVTGMLPRATSSLVPAGTLSIEVVMSAVGADGPYDDAYFDNLNLHLTIGPRQ